MFTVITNTLCFTCIGLTYGHIKWFDDEKENKKTCAGTIPLNFYPLYLGAFGGAGFVFGFVMGLFL